MKKIASEEKAMMEIITVEVKIMIEIMNMGWSDMELVESFLEDEVTRYRVERWHSTGLLITFFSMKHYDLFMCRYGNEINDTGCLLREG